MRPSLWTTGVNKHVAASTAAGSADGANASLSTSEQTFVNHKVSVGEWVAVYFDQGLFFGVVVEIKVLSKSRKKLVDADGPTDLQHRLLGTKVRVAWLELYDDEECHSDDAIPQYILGGADSYPCTYFLQYQACMCMHNMCMMYV